jgi:hypothetical protein
MRSKYLLADVDKLRAACLDGDLQAAMRIRDELRRGFHDQHRGESPFGGPPEYVYHSDKSLCEYLLLDVANLSFEICRWLLLGEKGCYKTPRGLGFLDKDLVELLDDVLCNTRRKIDLRLVRLLVNALRHRKGKHRHDYLLRLATHASSTSLPSSYLVRNADVLGYLVKCSLDYRACWNTGPQINLAEEGQSISYLLLGIMGYMDGHHDEHRDCLGICLAQILKNNGMDPDSLMPPHFRYMRLRSSTQLSVALHMGWVGKSWLVFADMLRCQNYPRTDLLESFIKSLPLSELTSSLALRIMKLVLVSDLDPRILDTLATGLTDELRAGLTDVLLEFIMGQKYHDLLMTRFVMRHAGAAASSLPPVTLAIRAHPKIASTVFYYLRARHPHCFAEPQSVSRMLAYGPQALVYAVVWETDARLVQLISGLFVRANAEGRLPGQRISWIKEMYNLRLILRQPRQASFVRFGSTPPFPRRVALNILRFGWLGEMVEL